MRDLILLAASGLARELASADLRDSRVVGVLDDNRGLHGTECAGATVLGGVALAAELDAYFVLCMGSGRARRHARLRLAELGVVDSRFATIIDASVRVPESCQVGVGSVVLAGTVLTASVTVGRHVVLMPHVTLTHDNVVDDFATLAAGVSLGGSVHVGEAASLGMNSSVRQGLVVGRDAVVGMGAVVLEQVPDAETWVGVPARAIERTVRA
ncbi:NeuD/PglB/VioB family sugar acetyltransferase [Leifsonia sp. YAF41]|uniref:NeuD/PglB/VioB family sugar acetyltransferase n=1 Tax=Leifsonia sp. YAF41 TaxID=3233086 RepID=UPI003F9BF90D